MPVNRLCDKCKRTILYYEGKVKLGKIDWAAVEFKCSFCGNLNRDEFYGVGMRPRVQQLP